MNEQSEMWAGPFGSEYIVRHDEPELISRKRAFFELALLATRHLRPARVIEFGASAGLNIQALRLLDGFQHTEFTGVDVQKDAIPRLQEIGVQAHRADITKGEAGWGDGYDISMSCGLLIHIHPNNLTPAYEALYRASRQFVFVAEYFAAERRMVEYRGHANKLWVADYGREIMAQFPDLTCVDYGFSWKGDPVTRMDNITWWLFEKPWRLPQLPKASRTQ